MRITLSKPLFIHELGKRSNQEDSYFISDKPNDGLSPFYMVCDGMGGHDKGEVASALVCQTMSSFIAQQIEQGRAFDDDLFNDALRQTYAELDKLPVEGKRPGTTLTFLCFHKQGVTTANIGDSRIYHLRPKEGKILFQSRDHSLVFDLYVMGELSFDEMATSPQKNVITKALMPGEENHHRADMVHIGDVQPGDCFLLCSDGLLEQITNEQLVNIFSKSDDMEEVRRLLIEASDDSADNHTAVLLKVEGVVPESHVPVVNDEGSSPFNALNVRPISNSQDTPAAPVIPVADTAEAGTSNTSNTPNVTNTAKKPNMPKKKSKGSPVLTIILAFLLVAVLAAIGVLLFKKSPKSKDAALPQLATAVAGIDSTAAAPESQVAAEAPAAQTTTDSSLIDTISLTPAQAAPAPHTTPNPASQATPAPHATPNPAPQAAPAPRTTPNPTPATSNAAQQRRDNLRDRSQSPK